MINPDVTRLQWLKQTQIKYAKEDDYKSSAYYGKLFDEQWEVENPLGILTNDNNIRKNHET